MQTEIRKNPTISLTFPEFLAMMEARATTTGAQSVRRSRVRNMIRRRLARSADLKVR